MISFWTRNSVKILFSFLTKTNTVDIRKQNFSFCSESAPKRTYIGPTATHNRQKNVTGGNLEENLVAVSYLVEVRREGMNGIRVFISLFLLVGRCNVPIALQHNLIGAAASRVAVSFK